jgi:TPR repeat protein
MSVPIFDFMMANQEVATEETELYYSCCGKSICKGCVYSFHKSGNNNGKCPFCNADQGKTDEEAVEELMKRVEANDPGAIWLLAANYHHGLNGIQQDHTKAMELYARAADLGCSKAHNNLGVIYEGEGNLKKAKFHIEDAAMAGSEVARYNIGCMEGNSGNIERAIKHWKIAASAGDYDAMNKLRLSFEEGSVSRESIDSTLVAYNNSCAEVRSEARDAIVCLLMIESSSS